MIEIDNLQACREWVAIGGDRPPAAFQHLDLRSTAGFETGSFVGCLFLSCDLTPAQAGFLTTMGATVIRDQHGRPFTSHRAALYTPEELFAGFDPDDPAGYESTYDAEVYRHWVESGRQYPPLIDESLARRLHDHSISDALLDELEGKRPVAVMGGHGLERSDPNYAMVARISRSLTRAGRLMLSGGGPGAMEATHLGAWMANFDDRQLDAAITVLAPRPAGSEPGKEFADADWLHRAFVVRNRWPLDHAASQTRYESIGIPTWMYGHEPPAAFATKIAKYFANSIREEGLLAVATSGVVFTPGSAGTIQEIFQDAAQNHYESFGPPAPMVLVGVDYWTRHRPVWPLLESLAEGYRYSHLITLTDDDQAVVDRILDFGAGA